MLRMALPPRASPCHAGATGATGARAKEEAMPKGAVRSLALTFSGPVAAQMKPAVTEVGVAPKSFLFVGNSFYYYNNSMHSVFLNFVRAADKAGAASYRATSATISGSGLNWP